MQLTYRGQSYLPRTVLTSCIDEGEVCIYRGQRYKKRRSVVESYYPRQQQRYIYRGVHYTKSV